MSSYQWPPSPTASSGAQGPQGAQGIPGTPASSSIGQYLQTTVSNQATSATIGGEFFDLMALTLPAGDWDVTGLVQYTPNAANVIYYDTAISTVAGNSTDNLQSGVNTLFSFPTGPSSTFNANIYVAMSIPNVRINLTASSTVFLKCAILASTVGVSTYFGRLSGRRFN